MSGTRWCDISGGVEIEARERDQDGLWVCSNCHGGLITTPVGDWENATLSDEVRIWVGKRKGQS